MAEGHGPEHTHAASTFDRLAARRMVIVSGKGGVGRTTLAALLGLAISRRGRRVLVATTGHDDRLAWMLGLPKLETAPRFATERLAVQRLEPHVCLREYGAMIVRSERIAAAVFDNRVVRRLLRAIPGLDDFTVLGKAWHEAVRGGVYDTVIFDGPATGHLLYTLGVPRAILSAIPPGPLTREAELMEQSLTDPQVTEAMLVGLPESWPLTELGELGGAVHDDLGITIGTIVVNGVWPRVSDSTARAATGPSPKGDPEVDRYLQWLEAIATGGRRHAEAIEAFRTGPAVGSGASELVTVPWRWGGIGSAADLEAVRRELEGGDHVAAVPPAADRALGG